jgi:hypothetical protein
MATTIINSMSVNPRWIDLVIRILRLFGVTYASKARD